jgi:hypothetical protein
MSPIYIVFTIHLIHAMSRYIIVNIYLVYQKYLHLFFSAKKLVLTTVVGRHSYTCTYTHINVLIFVGAFLDPRYTLSMYTKIIVKEIFGEDRG